MVKNNKYVPRRVRWRSGQKDIFEKSGGGGCGKKGWRERGGGRGRIKAFFIVNLNFFNVKRGEGLEQNR